MKPTLLLFTLLLSITVFAQTIAPEWTRTVPGNPPSNSYYLSDIESDVYGNVYQLAFLNAPGVSSLHLRKYDTNGNLQWHDSIPSTSNYGKLVILPSGSIVAGYLSYTNNSFINALTSFTPSGTVQWTHYLDDNSAQTNNSFMTMTSNDEGRIFLSSTTYSALTFFQQAYIFCADSFGNVIWEDSVAASNFNNHAPDLSPDRQGNVYAIVEGLDSVQNTQTLLIKYNASGQRARQQYFNTVDRWHLQFIRVFNDTTIYAAGYRGDYQNCHLVLTAYDSSLSVQHYVSNFWPQLYFNTGGADTTNLVHAMAVDAAGNVVLGTSLFYNTLWARSAVVHFNYLGSPDWAAVPQTAGSVTGVEFDNAGNIIAAGRYYDSLQMNEPLTISKIAPSGSFMWNAFFGTSIFNEPQLSLSPGGDIFIGSLRYDVVPDTLYLIKYGVTAGITEHLPMVTANVYPCPFSTEINFTVPDGELLRSAEITDAQGRIVAQFSNLNGTMFRFERGGLSSGVYFYTLILESGHNCRGKIIAD